jgi:hypothetical protein
MVTDMGPMGLIEDPIYPTAKSIASEIMNLESVP